jgi:hypothetical protein
VAVFGLPAFQFPHALQQHPQLPAQGGVLRFGGSVLFGEFLSRHVPSLPTPATLTEQLRYRLKDVIEAARYVETQQKIGNVVLTVS